MSWKRRVHLGLSLSAEVDVWPGDASLSDRTVVSEEFWSRGGAPLDLTPFTRPRDWAQLLLASRASDTCMSLGTQAIKPCSPVPRPLWFHAPSGRDVTIASGSDRSRLWAEREEVFLILLAFTFV